MSLVFSVILVGIGLVVGVTTGVAVSCARWRSVVPPIKEENQRLRQQVTHLSEQITCLRRNEKFLFNAYCKADALRRRERDHGDQLAKMLSALPEAKRLHAKTGQPEAQALAQNSMSEVVSIYDFIWFLSHLLSLI